MWADDWLPWSKTGGFRSAARPAAKASAGGRDQTNWGKKFCFDFWSSFSSKPNVNQCKRFQIWTIRSGSISKLVDIEAAVEAAGTWKHIAEDEHHHQHGTWRCKCLNRSTCFPELSPRRRNWLDSLPRRNPDMGWLNSLSIGLSGLLDSHLPSTRKSKLSNQIINQIDPDWIPNENPKSKWVNEGRAIYLCFFCFCGRSCFFFLVPGSMLSCFCFFASLLFAFSASLLVYFSAFLLLLFCFSAFLPFLLFAFSASLLYLLYLLLFFLASLLSLLLCFCASVPFYFYYSTFFFSSVLCFAALLLASLLLCFLSLLPLCFFHFLLLYSPCLYPKWNPKDLI